jgi:hypothetical protein
VQPVALAGRQTFEDMVLSVGSHGLDAQRQWTVYMTPVPRKGGEIDVITIPNESAANDHATFSWVMVFPWNACASPRFSNWPSLMRMNALVVYRDTLV